MTGKKILIVDDSQTVRHQVRQALLSRGFDLIEAVDGLAGLAQLRLHPDLAVVLCDIHMPNMSGLELLEVARGEGLSTPIIMLSSEGQPSLVQRARQLGAKGWVVKPFDADRLVAVVDKLVNAGSVSKT